MKREIEIGLAARRDAPAIARGVVDQLADVLSPSALQDSRLMISELVTNALRHGQASNEGIGLRLIVDRGLLRVEVRDEGPGFTPEPRTADSADDSGWGLFLVSELADRWGISSDGATLVWFEVAVSADA